MPGGAHAHLTPLNLSGITWVSQYQIVNTNLGFTEARDGEWQWHQLVYMQVCTLSKQITMQHPTTQFFC